MSIKRYLNPDASEPTLGFKFHKDTTGRDADVVAVAAYDVTPSGALGTVTSITFKNASGGNVTVAIPSTGTGLSAIKRGLATALQSKGVDPYYPEDDFNGISINGKTIRFIGTVQIVSVTIGGVSTNASAAKTTLALRSKYRFAIEYDAEVGTLGSGVSGGTVVVASPYYAAETDVADIVTDVNAALAAEGFTLGGTTVVTDNTALGIYEVTFYTVGTTPVYKAGSILTPLSVDQTFV
jgi:hypothetical protein